MFTKKTYLLTELINSDENKILTLLSLKKFIRSNQDDKVVFFFFPLFFRSKYILHINPTTKYR